MKSLIAVWILIYIIGLHCSIALMEIFSWTTFALIVAWKIKTRSRFDFPLLVPMLLLILIVLVSLLLNPWLRPFWFQLGYMRWVVLFYSFYWALGEVWSPEFEFRALSVWNVCIFIAGIYALAQCFLGIDLIRPGVQKVMFEDWGHYHATGYFAMKATSFFSLSLTFAYVMGISMFAAMRPSLAIPRLRLWAWVARGGAIAGIFASMSRGAWISLVLCGLISFTVTWPRRMFKVYGAGLALGIVLFFLSPWFHDHLLAIRPDHSGMMRVDLWRAYGLMFREHPWFGIGLLQGDYLLPEYYAKLGIVQPFVSHAHNVYLQWAAGAGIFALLTYLWISLAMLRLAWRLRAHSNWGLGLFLGQLFMHFGAFTECNFFDGEVLHMMVFAWALTVMLARLAQVPPNASFRPGRSFLWI